METIWNKHSTNKVETVKNYDHKFWVSHQQKWISFRERVGFEIVELIDYEEMWSVIHTLISTGYVVS